MIEPISLNEQLLGPIYSANKGAYVSVNDRDIFCVDIDNVLGQTDEVMRNIIRVATTTKGLPSGVDYCYEDIKKFDYSLCKDRSGNSVTADVWNAAHQIFQDPNSGYVDLIKPMEGALEGLKELAEWWDIWIVTARHDGGLKKATAWVEKHFPGFSRNVHSSYDRKKWEVANFQAAVDDHLETALGFAGRGAKAFVYDHPWNRKAADYPLLTVVTNWSQLVTAMKGSGAGAGPS